MNIQPDVGDIIEIQYRFGKAGGVCHDARWIAAEIIAHDDETWPLARLCDGQLTELRPFMTWRRVATRH